MMKVTGAVANRSIIPLLAGAAAVLVIFALVPLLVGLYQIQLFTYGLIAAIPALGFNFLLGYNRFLSFGHLAFFGIWWYIVPFPVKGPRHSLDGSLYSDRHSDCCDRVGVVRLYLRPTHANLLRHLDAGSVTGGVQPGAKAVLDHWWNRRAARGAADAACDLDQLFGPGRVPTLFDHLLLLRAGRFRDLRRVHWGDRSLAIRQGTSGHPR